MDYLDVEMFNDNDIKVVFQEDMDRRHTLELL